MALPDLNGESISLSQLDLLYQVQNIINSYVIKNILLLNSAANNESITVINPNLYQLAAQYYNNADQWTQIAVANNLSDPFYQGTIQLLIPPLSPQSSGGILNPPTS